MPQDPSVQLIGRRIKAGWIDVALLTLVFVVLSLVAGDSHVGHWTTDINGFAYHQSGASINLNGWPLIAWIVIFLLYYFVSELLTAQSPGKAIMGLRVVTISGQPLSARVILIRTLGRIIDVLPAFYLIGWLAMRGPRRPPQRLGDRMAGTTVQIRG